MRDLNRSSLLSTAVIAVLSTIICPSARGGPVFFTAKANSCDDWQGCKPKTFVGGVGNQAIYSHEVDGFATVPAWGIEAPYSGYAQGSAQLAPTLQQNGTLNVGYASLTGGVEGYDHIKATGIVNFYLTIGEIEPLPPGVAPAPSIPILFAPTIVLGCQTEAWPPGFPPGSSTCKASGSATITDTTTGASMSDRLPPISGTASAFLSPANSAPLSMSVSPDDTLSIILTDSLSVGGGVAACGSPGYWEICGTLDAFASATVDPLFEFNQAAFDTEMGANAYSLSEYFGFDLIPVPTTVPEPPVLMLLGTNLLILASLLRWRFGRTRASLEVSG